MMNIGRPCHSDSGIKESRINQISVTNVKAVKNTHSNKQNKLCGDLKWGITFYLVKQLKYGSRSHCTWSVMTLISKKEHTLVNTCRILTWWLASHCCGECHLFMGQRSWDLLKTSCWLHSVILSGEERILQQCNEACTLTVLEKYKVYIYI